MSQEPTPATVAVGRRPRSKRPERIDLGDDVAVRNDVIAAETGVSERTLNRDDALGAPFLLIGATKYRPYKQYKKFLASRIQRKNLPRRRLGR